MRPIPWRVGRKVGRTIYDADDQLIGVMDTPEMAAAVVAAINSSAAGKLAVAIQGVKDAAPKRSGYHKHKCAFCAYVWEHHDCNDVRHGDGGAHECPSCHRCNWSLGIYEGADEPRIKNGVDPGPAYTGFGMIHPDQDYGVGG